MPDSQRLSSFLQLEAEIRSAKTLPEFAFSACNSTKKIISYHQAIFWYRDITGHIKIQAVSGTAQINPDAPFILWLKKAITYLNQHPPELPQAASTSNSSAHTVSITAQALPENLQTSWPEWLPAYTLWCPFYIKKGKAEAGLWFNQATAWTQDDHTILTQLNQAYAHAWYALRHQSHKTHHTLDHSTSSQKRPLLIIASLTLLAFFLIPLRQSVLAPAEIVAKNPSVISAGLEGVIEKIEVTPNESVEKGQVLFSLDATELSNRYALAQKNLEVTREKYRKAAQHAFTHPESRAELSVLQTEISKSETELAYTKELLDKITIHAPHAGIVIFSDKNDWIGKPVAIGERVMLIAAPDDKELDIKLPTQDAITLADNSSIKLFLNIDPLHPITAKLRYASYSAEPQPDGRLAYDLKATFPEGVTIPRIGLQGTAKIYGKRVTLFYYLFWKPLSAVRRTLGL